jgi:outer membrane protein OmpA-like peptidoglycan-associated protein
MQLTRLVLLTGLMLPPLAASAFGQEVDEISLTAQDAQNFAVSAPGELRIVGDENRYDIVLPADVLFDFDKAELRPDAEPILAKLKAHFAEHGSSQVHVQGHTDSKGSVEHNLTLSIDRATAVCDWLKSQAAVSFTNCIGKGEAEPLLPNENADGSDNPENRQLNRRVTVSVVLYPDVNAMLNDAQKAAEDAKASLPQ